MDKINLTQIKEAIDEYSGKDISSKSRKGYLPFYRKYYFLIAKEYTNTFNLSEIGKVVGRDHSTVVVGIQKLYNLLEFDKEINSHYNHCNNFVLKKLPQLLNQKVTFEEKVEYNYISEINQLKKELKSIRSRHKNLRAKNKRLLVKAEALKTYKKGIARIYQFKYRANKAKEKGRLEEFIENSDFFK